eukprot:scaffold29047_cov43-Cyclotella_meneghiniana.AAC.6
MLPSCRRRCSNQSGSRGSPKRNLQSHSNSNCWGGGWIMENQKCQPVLERVLLLFIVAAAEESLLMSFVDELPSNN